MKSNQTIDIVVPDFGGQSHEVTLVAWLKSVGDPVQAGEPILEVMTDKANVEVESPAAGTIVALLAEKDAVVEVGSVVGRIASSTT